MVAKYSSKRASWLTAVVAKQAEQYSVATRRSLRGAIIGVIQRQQRKCTGGEQSEVQLSDEPDACGGGREAKQF